MEDQQTQSPSFLSRHKKKIIIGGVIAVVLLTILGIFLYQRSKTADQARQPGASKTAPQSNQVTLSFSPYDITTDKNFSYRTSNIALTTAGKKITGVEIVLLYDPKALQNVSVIVPSDSLLKKNGSFKVLKNEINKQEGIITFSVGVTDTSKPISEDGVLVAFSYSLLPSFSDPTTAVVFLNKSAVTQVGLETSILDTTKPLIIRTGK